MSFIINGLTTGLLGYRLHKDFLGEGLFYRETETYNWKVYSRPDPSHDFVFSEIETHIKQAFAGYSGDIKVKALNTPADYTFPNDHLRIAEFNVDIEIRKPIASILSFNPELSSDRYKGLNDVFFTNYGTWLNNFSEEFSFDSNEDGSSIFSHNVSFSLESGDKTKAQEIISSIFSNDKDTTLGINVYTNGAVVANTDNYLNYYNESYDTIKNAYSFSRKREILPASGLPYLYDLSHSVTYKNNGYIDVSERAKINSRKTFSQAQDGFSALYAGAYDRCNAQFSTFSNWAAGSTVTDGLVNLPINSNRTLNKLSNTIEYEVGFTNDSNVNIVTQTTREKITEIERNEQGFIGINQNFNYTSLITPISANSDGGYVTAISLADTESSVEVQSLYTTSSFYDPKRSTMKRIKISSSTPNRKKQFNLSISYTNNPIYFVTLNSTVYAILEYSVSDAKPADIITEYKIINRPTKSSIVNYAYQTERGVKTISITTRLQRSASNMFTNPRSNISSNLHEIYKYAIGKAMETFNGNIFIALSYYLSDLKYTINSDNELTMEIAMTYAIKKYLN